MKKYVILIFILILIFPVDVFAFESSSYIGGNPIVENSNAVGFGNGSGVGGKANFNHLAAVPYMKISLVKLSDNGGIKSKVSSIYYHNVPETRWVNGALRNYTWGGDCATGGPSTCDSYSQIYLWTKNKIGNGKVIGDIGSSKYLTNSEKIINGEQNLFGYNITAANILKETKVNWGYSSYNALTKFNVGAIGDYFKDENNAKSILNDLNFLKNVGCNDYEKCDSDNYKNYAVVIEPVGAFCKYSNGWYDCYYATFKGYSKYVADNFSKFSSGGLYNGYVTFDGYGDDNFRNFVYAYGYNALSSKISNEVKYSKSYFEQYSSIDSIYGWGIIEVNHLNKGGDDKKSSCAEYVNQKDSITIVDNSITSCKNEGVLESSNIIFVDVKSKIKSETSIKKSLDDCKSIHGDNCNFRLCNNSVSVKVNFREEYDLDPSYYDITNLNLFPGGLLRVGYSYSSVSSWKIIEDSYDGKVSAQVIYKDNEGKIWAYSDEMFFNYSYEEMKDEFIDKIKGYFNVVDETKFSVFGLDDAGAWNCSYEDIDEDEDDIFDNRSTICEYNLKYVTLKQSENEVVASYSDNSSNESSGRAYYLSRFYSSDVFKWRITTNNSNISSINRVFNIKINTTDSDQICKAKVFDGPGSNKGNSKIIYRTVAVENPFPKGKMGEEWQIYRQKYPNTYLNRLANSYQYSNLDYSIDIENYGNKIEIKNIDDNYNDFSKINLDGTSKFVTDYFYNDKGNHCMLGEFSWGCDS